MTGAAGWSGGRIGVAEAARVQAPEAVGATSVRSRAPGDLSGSSRASASPVAAHLLWLQGAAGNRAVNRLVQRQVPPTPPPTVTVDVPIGTRIAEATAAVKAKAIDDPAWEAWRTGGGTATAIALQLWMNELALPDVDPAALRADKATRKNAGPAAKLEKLLRTRVRTAIKAKLDGLVTELASPTGRTRLRGQVDRLAGFGAGWDKRAFTDPLWSEWVGSGRIGQLDGAARASATKLYENLEGAADAALVGDRTTPVGIRETAFSTTATAGRDAREVAAVAQALRARTTWVVGAPALEALTDETVAIRGIQAPRGSPDWQALNGRMKLLLIDAEAAIVRDKFDKDVTSNLWAEMRDRYVRTITKPIWRYWDEDIVDGSFFGHKITKSKTSGLHRDVAAAVGRVEQSAMRIGQFADVKALSKTQGTKATTGGPTGTNNPGSQFRFEADSHKTWMRTSAHLSYHGTGRAMDFRLAVNPAIQGEGHQLIGILADEELPEGGSDRGVAASWAARLADLDQQRKDIVAARDLATGDEKAQLEQRLADFDRGAAAAPQHATATRLRDNATDVWNRVTAIETAFQAAWTEATKGNPDNDKLAATLLVRVDALKSQVEADIKALPATNKAQKAVLEQRLARLAPVRKMLTATSTTGKAARDTMLGKVGSAAAGGLTDLPLWMVQAFAENGWNWGVWRGHIDAMHFDYMGPVSGVIDQ